MHKRVVVFLSINIIDRWVLTRKRGKGMRMVREEMRRMSLLVYLFPPMALLYQSKAVTFRL